MDKLKKFKSYSDMIKFLQQNKIQTCERRTDKKTGDIILIYNK